MRNRLKQNGKALADKLVISKGSCGNLSVLLKVPGLCNSTDMGSNPGLGIIGRKNYSK